MAVRNNKGYWSVYWKDKDTGKQVEKHFGKGQANKFRAQRYNERMGFGKQKRQAPTKEPFHNYLELYLNHLKATTNNKRNFQNTLSFFTGTILPFFENYDLYALVHSDLDDYVNHRKSQTTRLGRPPKNVTINREIDEIQEYLNWCVTNKKILKNDLLGYRRPKDDREVIDPPTVAEINKIIAHAAPHVQRFVILSYYIGSRPGPIETGALKWEHISWEEKRILIRSADKGGLNSRRVNIHETLMAYLQEWYLQDQNDEIPVSNIIHYKKKPVASIKTGYKRAKQRAGITRRLRPYDIRHAHVTHQLDAGADLKAVSLNVGHKSPDTTIKVYQHVSGALQKQAIEKLPALGLPLLWPGSSLNAFNFPDHLNNNGPGE